jgi:uncharacterized protein with HEPN domain
MSKHETLATLRQLKEFVTEATELAKGSSRADLAANLRFRRHAERVIEPMGEACNRVPEEVVERHPEIPWREIVGMRNWLAHGYDGIDYDILWNTISRDAQDLLDKIGPVIDEELAKDREPERDISDDL